MNTVVNQLLDVDKEARRVLDSAQQYFDDTINDIEKEKQQMIDNYNKKAAAHLAVVDETESAICNDSIAATKQHYDSLTATLLEYYNKNVSDWQNQLYAKCIGR